MQSLASTPLNNLEVTKKIPTEIQEYLWIAGQPEHRTTFEATTSIFNNDSSMAISMDGKNKFPSFSFLRLLLLHFAFFIILVNSSEMSSPQYFLS
jgi:hypothetical protein